MHRRILLLMPTSTYRASAFLEAARRIGVEAAVGSNERQALEDYTPGTTLALAFPDIAGSVQRIREFARHNPLDAILSVDDAATELAARAAKVLDLPHNPADAARAVRNKYRMRKTLAPAGILTPPFRLYPASEDPPTPTDRVPFPCVLKPISLAGSRGVIRADNEPEFETAFRRLAAILREPDVQRSGGEEAHRILVEGYIPGTEVALEGLLSGGSLKTLAIFDKPDPLVGPFFEETILVTPSRLSPTVKEEIVACAGRTVEALGLREGPIHAEMRLNHQGVWPIDIAARSIGGLCSRSLRFSEGMSLEEVILRHALGMVTENPRRDGGASGVMMIPIPSAGILVKIQGLEKARAVPGIQDVRITLNPGREMVPLPEGNRYLGFLFARGDSPEGVEEALRRAHRQIRFTIQLKKA